MKFDRNKKYDIKDMDENSSERKDIMSDDSNAEGIFSLTNPRIASTTYKTPAPKQIPSSIIVKKGKRSHSINQNQTTIDTTRTFNN